MYTRTGEWSDQKNIAVIVHAYLWTEVSGDRKKTHRVHATASKLQAALTSVPTLFVEVVVCAAVKLPPPHTVQVKAAPVCFATSLACACGGYSARSAGGDDIGVTSDVR